MSDELMRCRKEYKSLLGSIFAVQTYLAKKAEINNLEDNTFCANAYLDAVSIIQRRVVIQELDDVNLEQ